MANDRAAGLLGGIFTKLRAYNLPELDLLSYDIVLIPSYSNQDILYDNRDRFQRFLEHGGVLIALGAVQDKKPWLECCEYDPHFPTAENVELLAQQTPEAKAILGDLRIESLKFHDGFFSHGTFRADPSGCVTLIADKRNQRNAVLAVLSPGVSGHLLVTTLDPDYHATVGHNMVDGRSPNLKAERLFKSIVKWAIDRTDLRSQLCNGTSDSPLSPCSCFISYSSKDQEFADRLHANLQDKGVRCWFAPEDLKIGDPFRQRIDEAIRVYDKLLLILSVNSVRSDWVREEVETCCERERLEHRLVLFPVRLDDAVMATNQAWAGSIRRQRHIGDFSNWRDHDSYQMAFQRLVRDLRAQEAGPAGGG
jgi:TIR domain